MGALRDVRAAGWDPKSTHSFSSRLLGGGLCTFQTVKTTKKIFAQNAETRLHRRHNEVLKYLSILSVNNKTGGRNMAFGCTREEFTPGGDVDLVSHKTK